MGVGSNRVDVKQAAARAERSLERLAEPLSALFLPAERVAGTVSGRWPGRSWSATPPTTRSAPARSTTSSTPSSTATPRPATSARAWPTRPCQPWAGRWPSPGRWWSTRRPGTEAAWSRWWCRRSGEVGPDVQVLSERLGLPGSITLDGETVRNMLGLIQGARIDDDRYITDVSLAEDETGLDVTLVIGTEARDGVPVEEVKRELFTRLTARPDTEVRLTLDQPPVRRILARQARVPGFGWARFAPGAAGPSGRTVDEARRHGPVTLANGLVTVVVDPDDGTFSIDGVPGYGRLVDGGDYGDTYNYSPPTTTPWSTRPDSVSVTVGERGPGPGHRRPSPPPTPGPTGWTRRPKHAGRQPRGPGGHHPRAAGRRAASCGCDTRFVNPSRDHRLRVHLPLPRPAATSRAECAFTVVERGLDRRGPRPTRSASPPSRRAGSSRAAG